MAPFKPIRTVIICVCLTIGIANTSLALVLEAISPASGPTEGGQRVRIDGYGFEEFGTTTVRFGDVYATGVVVHGGGYDWEYVTCNTPPHVAGIVGVTLTNPNGQSATLSNAYTYDCTFLLSEVSPYSGLTWGGTEVTITGTCFSADGTTSVFFADVPAAAVHVDGTTAITCIAPPHAPGPVDVTVVNTDRSRYTLADAFTYASPSPVEGEHPCAEPPATTCASDGIAIQFAGWDAFQPFLGDITNDWDSNGIADNPHFALLQYVLATASLDIHCDVRAAWEANASVITATLDTFDPSILPNPGLWPNLRATLETSFIGTVTFGDPYSCELIITQFDSLGMTLDLVDLDMSAGAYLAGDGDADLDGVCNTAEYYASLAAPDGGDFMTRALDPSLHDDNGVCGPPCFATPAVTYTLTVAALGEGSVTPVPGEYTYGEDAEVALSATPADGWVFDHWQGDFYSLDANGTLVMDRSQRVYAVFRPDTDPMFYTDITETEPPYTEIAYNPGLPPYTSLWDITSRCLVAEGEHSAPRALVFADHDTCTYGGGAYSGYATTYPINTTGFDSPAMLLFNYRLETEGCPGEFDIATVEISVNGEPFQVVAANTGGTEVLPLRDPTSGWERMAVPLPFVPDAWIGIRFGFDSVDSLNNDYAGFLIDDITLYAFPDPEAEGESGTPCPEPCTEACSGEELDPNILGNLGGSLFVGSTISAIGGSTFSVDHSEIDFCARMKLLEYALENPALPAHCCAVSAWMANSAALASAITPQNPNWFDVDDDFWSILAWPTPILYCGLATTGDPVDRKYLMWEMLLSGLSLDIRDIDASAAPYFSDQGDADGDGVCNLAEYNAVVCRQTDFDLFVQNAFDPAVAIDGGGGLAPCYAETAPFDACLGIPINGHTADRNADYRINLSELLRVIQFFNSGGYHCQSGTEDNFGPAPGSHSCDAHASDYNPQDWLINLSELLRLIQFFNSDGYHQCPGEVTEDGFCVGAGA